MVLFEDKSPSVLNFYAFTLLVLSYTNIKLRENFSGRLFAKFSDMEIRVSREMFSCVLQSRVTDKPAKQTMTVEFSGALVTRRLQLIRSFLYISFNCLRLWAVDFNYRKTVVAKDCIESRAPFRPYEMLIT